MSPQQFWIYLDKNDDLRATGLPISFNDGTEVKHVVVMSAYERLLTELHVEKDRHQEIIREWQNRCEDLRAANFDRDELNAKVAELEAHAKNLYDALNCADGYISPIENKRTHQICYKALTEWEKYLDEKEKLK